MKLLKIESEEKGIWYFTTVANCARFLNVTNAAIKYFVSGANKRCKGFTKAEWIESDTVLSGQINPTREKYVELYECNE